MLYIQQEMWTLALLYKSVTIIIPTYSRIKSLERVLNSLLTQTTLPKEVLIIDDSDDDKTEKLFEIIKINFDKMNIIIKYIRNLNGRSLTRSRNIGIKNAEGDIILFLDDDVILDKNYIFEILDVYKNPYAKGVQGFILQETPKGFIPLILRTIAKLFMVSFADIDACRVFVSTSQTYPSILRSTVQCQWLAGCNQSYIRHIFNEFQFDEKLIRYSFKEDLDFSYRIWKKYPNSLYITPGARLIHEKSIVSRIPSRSLIYMRQTYTLYIFYKDFDQTMINRLIYIWSKIGEFLFLILSPFLPKEYSTKNLLLEIKFLLKAQLFCFKYRYKIRTGDLSFFDQLINKSEE